MALLQICTEIGIAVVVVVAVLESASESALEEAAGAADVDVNGRSQHLWQCMGASLAEQSEGEKGPAQYQAAVEAQGPVPSFARSLTSSCVELLERTHNPRLL